MLMQFAIVRNAITINLAYETRCTVYVHLYVLAYMYMQRVGLMVLVQVVVRSLLTRICSVRHATKCLGLTNRTFSRKAIFHNKPMSNVFSLTGLLITNAPRSIERMLLCYGNFFKKRMLVCRHRSHMTIAIIVLRTS